MASRLPAATSEVLTLLEASGMVVIFTQLAWFVFVGCTAAATHWLIAMGCVTVWQQPPLLANLIGWLVAFLVSFGGHYRLTFRYQQNSLAIACGRFFLVSASGFVINELSYAFLLHVTNIAYDLLLAVILVAIAVLTFILSRYWVFRHRIS
ncbi:GtrA family protein [Candidatus Accumulibacter phosphatis]|uniref:GtrA family protein n=1 Tax=Candidatus Accumulibacter phosphatis TaxID=327160 RepID=UPI0032B25E7B